MRPRSRPEGPDPLRFRTAPALQSVAAEAPMRRVQVRSVVLLGVLAGCGGGGGEQEAALTYHGDIEPILRESCLGCHVEGQIAPFELDSYEQVVRYANLVKLVTAERIMPPWPVDNGGDCQTYRDARWLTDEEIARIGAWVDGGMEEGTPPETPLPVENVETLSGETVLLDPGVSYTPVESGNDDYRCFIVDPGLAEDRFLTGFEVMPGEPEEVHHMVLFAVVSEDGETDADALDAAQEGPGYRCYGASGVAAIPVAAWAPGARVFHYPEGTGLRLRAGRRLIMQLHYNVSAGALPDRTTIRLEVRADVAQEAFLGGVGNPRFTLAPGLPETTVRIALDPIEVAQGLLGLEGEEVELRGVFPHMHTLGTSLRLQRQATGECITESPSWDFDWQQFVFYDAPIAIRQGDVLALRCDYDTTSREEPVESGIDTDREMCLVGMYATVPGMARLPNLRYPDFGGF
jgi:hypothetical protein